MLTFLRRLGGGYWVVWVGRFRLRVGLEGGVMLLSDDPGVYLILSTYRFTFTMNRA